MESAEIIRDLCAKNKTSIARLEKELGLGNGTIASSKSNYMRSDRLKAVADYFHVSMEYLMTGVDVSMESKVTEHPCLHDLGFMDYVMKLWSLPPERKDPILRQIRLETADYREEVREKEGTLRA